LLKQLGIETRHDFNTQITLQVYRHRRGDRFLYIDWQKMNRFTRSSGGLGGFGFE
jgi:hypothetical protein